MFPSSICNLFHRIDELRNRQTTLIFFFINFDKIDLTDYSFLPIGLVSMLTQFSITSSDRNYIPMFSRTELFLVYLRLNNKVVIQLYCVQIPVSV